MRIAVALAALRELLQNPLRMRFRMAFPAGRNPAVGTGMAGDTADLPVGAPPALQALLDSGMTGGADGRIGIFGKNCRLWPVGRMAASAGLFATAAWMGRMAFKTREGFSVLLVAGGAGKTGMTPWGRRKIAADRGVAVETSIDRFPGQRQSERPVGIAMTGQTRPLPIDMSVPLMAFLTRPDDFHRPGRMSTGMAVEAADR